MRFADGAWEGESRSEEEVMSVTSRRRRFANSMPSRWLQTLWYSWDETLKSDV